jgi:hypothetical protein
MRRAFVTLLIPSALCGCSTLDTYFERPTVYNGMPQGLHVGYPPQVATLSMDASRRLMIMKLGNNPTSCSEPAPDTATSLLASTKANGSIKTQAGQTANAAVQDAFNANAQLIANRTAAVEFWRTTSFEYCQLLMNGDPGSAAAYLQAAEKLAPNFITAPPKQVNNQPDDQAGGDAEPQHAETPVVPAQLNDPGHAALPAKQSQGGKAAKKNVRVAAHR